MPKAYQETAIREKQLSCKARTIRDADMRCAARTCKTISVKRSRIVLQAQQEESNTDMIQLTDHQTAAIPEPVVDAPKKAVTNEPVDKFKPIKIFLAMAAVYGGSKFHLLDNLPGSSG